MKCFASVLFTLVLLPASLFSQSQPDLPAFTIRIGTYAHLIPADFDNLKPYGYLFAVPREDNHSDLYMGGFTSQDHAQDTADKVRDLGYAQATVLELHTEAGKSQTLIQLATIPLGESIQWDRYLKVAPLFVMLNEKEIKLFSGGYPDPASARSELPRIKSLGFSDAFIRNVNDALLHEVTGFETGISTKKPLIPLDFAKKETGEEKASQPKSPDVRPETYEIASIIIHRDEPVLTPKGDAPAPVKAPAEIKTETSPVPPAENLQPEKKTIALKETETPVTFAAETPDIRSKIKRTSAEELQKVLKKEGTYKSPIDGYYGKGTLSAYELAVQTNRQLQKYRILAKHISSPGLDATPGSLQYFVDNLWEDPHTCLEGLQKSKAPVAKAYRSYFLFTTEGASTEVNRLMNESINEAFASDKRASLPAFDPSATYAYQDLGQLLKHLRYVHEASNEGVTAPCWLFRRHPGAALQAFGEMEGSRTSLSMQNCGGFWEWEEIRILHAIASDLSSPALASEAALTTGQADLARLYLTPHKTDWNERKSLKEWNDSLWQGINAWGTRDPMLAEIATAMKISYLQTQVLLEDFYMDEGFDEKDAQGLALAALQALLGPYTERFI